MAFSRRETALLIGGDLLILALSLWLALALRNLEIPSIGYFLRNILPFLPVFLVSLVIFFIAGLYEKQTKLVRSLIGTRILGAQIANTIIAAVLFFLLPLSIAPKTILALYLVISVVLISSLRFSVVPRIGVRTRRPAILVGTGPAVGEVLDEVNGNDHYGLFFVEHIDTVASVEHPAPRVRQAIREGAKAVVIDTRDPRLGDDMQMLNDTMLAGVAFIEFSSFYEDIFDRVPLGHIDYAWILESLPNGPTFYDLAKRVFDITLAAVLFVISVILIVPAAVALSLAGGQPFIFHERIGRGGKRFRIIKLRTMLMDDHGDPELQKKNRVTALGRFLRKTRIDELPQLVNIFSGNLSFIGPRPELPSIAAVYEKEIPYYHTRHLIPPGLSGWAQIHDYDAPRGPADVARTRRKLSYDLYYVKRRSFGLDIGIALKTLRALLAFSGT